MKTGRVYQVEVKNCYFRSKNTAFFVNLIIIRIREIVSGTIYTDVLLNIFVFACEATSFVQYFLSDIQQTVSGWIESVVDIPEQQSLSALRERFFYNNMSLQPHQTDYVLDITESREKLEAFRQFYCIKKDKNPFIYGHNLIRLCDQIENTKF